MRRGFKALKTGKNVEKKKGGKERTP